jgi:hypothetical protein
MVQTCKKGLRKTCFTGNKKDWDLAVPYITMGNRMSKYVSLFHFVSYFLLFGKHPIPPSSIITQMDQVVDLDSPTTWAKVIAEIFYLGRLCPWPWRTCPLNNIETPYGMHTHEVAITNLRWDNLMLVTLCMSQPHFEGVWGWHSHSRNGDLGVLWNQSSIARVKTPRLEVFFILLNFFWSVDVENGLAWAIWTSAA